MSCLHYSLACLNDFPNSILIFSFVPSSFSWPPLIIIDILCGSKSSLHVGGDSIQSIHVWVGHFWNLRRILNVFIFMNVHVVASTKTIVNRLYPREWRWSNIDTSGGSSRVWSSLHIAGFALLSLVLQVHEDYQTQKHKAKGAGRNDEELAHFVNGWYWDTCKEKTIYSAIDEELIFKRIKWEINL